MWGLFFFLFFFFCKSLKEMTVATARHRGWGGRAEMELGWEWERREVEEEKPRKRDSLSPYAFKSSQESTQKIVTVSFRNCALSGKNTLALFFFSQVENEL